MAQARLVVGAAQGKEVGVRAEGRHAQHVLEDGQQLRLQAVGGRHERVAGHRGPVGQRQRAAVHSIAHKQPRHLVQRDQHARHHVRRQLVRQRGRQRARVQALGRHIRLRACLNP